MSCWTSKRCDETFPSLSAQRTHKKYVSIPLMTLVITCPFVNLSVYSVGSFEELCSEYIIVLVSTPDVITVSTSIALNVKYTLLFIFWLLDTTIVGPV